MEKEGNKETCEQSSLTLTLVDESRKVLGTLYRAMKPLLDDFNPEMTGLYDECLKCIQNSSYLQSAIEVKRQYGETSCRRKRANKQT
jgi:hypothetical protein